MKKFIALSTKSYKLAHIWVVYHFKYQIADTPVLCNKMLQLRGCFQNWTAAPFYLFFPSDLHFTLCKVTEWQKYKQKYHVWTLYFVFLLGLNSQFMFSMSYQGVLLENVNNYEANVCTKHAGNPLSLTTLQVSQLTVCLFSFTIGRYRLHSI